MCNNFVTDALDVFFLKLEHTGKVLVLQELCPSSGTSATAKNAGVQHCKRREAGRRVCVCLRVLEMGTEESASSEGKNKIK